MFCFTCGAFSTKSKPKIQLIKKLLNYTVNINHHFSTFWFKVTVVEFTNIETKFDQFMKNVKECIDDSNRKIYDNPPINSDDPHAIW